MPDACVNGLHYDLENLSVKRLAQLTEIVSTGEHERLLQQNVKTLLHEAASAGQLNRDQTPRDERGVMVRYR